MASPNKLNDFNPTKFTIFGFCANCDHNAPIPRHNEEIEIPTLIERLSCGQCGSKDCSIRIVYTGAGEFAYRVEIQNAWECTALFKPVLPYRKGSLYRVCEKMRWWSPEHAYAAQF